MGVSCQMKGEEGDRGGGVAGTGRARGRGRGADGDGAF